MTDMPVSMVTDWYRAVKAFDSLLHSKENMITYKLQPGELYLLIISILAYDIVILGGNPCKEMPKLDQAAGENAYESKYGVHNVQLLFYN